MHVHAVLSTTAHALLSILHDGACCNVDFCLCADSYFLLTVHVGLKTLLLIVL